jgi:hypothetical protein
MKILTITTNFGFGPVSKLCTIINEINGSLPNSTVDFIGSGHSLSFVNKNTSVSSVIELDTDKDAHKIIDYIDRYTLIIIVMNTKVLPFLKSSNVLSYFVDSLSWFWEKSPIGIENIDKYFIQDFLYDEQKMRNISTNFELVNPIIDDFRLLKKPHKANQLLVNFSGTKNPFSNDEFYYYYIETMSRLIISIAKSRFDKIIFTCSQNIVDLFSSKYSNNGISFMSMNKKSFITEAQRSSKVLSTSGITFYLESKLLKIPVFYLLPTNYSQALLNQKYISQFNEIGLTLSVFGNEYLIAEGMSEEEAVKKVNYYVIDILKNKIDIIADTITNYLDSYDNLDISFSPVSLGQKQILSYIRRHCA